MPLAVVYKFTEDQGPYLAALIAYYAFLSLIPLLLLLASVLGFLLQSDPGLRRSILDSTLAQFPVIGDQLGQPTGLRGSVPALITGSLVAVFGALGVAQAVQHSINVAWAIPRHRRANPLRSRLRSLILIALGGLTAIVTTVLSAVVGSGGAFGSELGGWRMAVAGVASLAVNGSMFVLAFRICTPPRAGRRDIVPGALVAAVTWQALQVFGTAIVGRSLKGAGATYGAFALVLGLLGWLFVAGLGVVFGAELNVVRSERLSPRSLVSPFTDDVDLTVADRRAYTAAATAQSFKGFETVTVEFDDDGQAASARRERDRERDRA